VDRSSGIGSGGRSSIVPDAHLIEATDALVRVRQAAICGSDPWPYKSMEPTESGRRMGHEFIGVVEDLASDVNMRCATAMTTCKLL